MGPEIVVCMQPQFHKSILLKLETVNTDLKSAKNVNGFKHKIKEKFCKDSQNQKSNTYMFVLLDFKICTDLLVDNLENAVFLFCLHSFKKKSLEVPSWTQVSLISCLPCKTWGVSREHFQLSHLLHIIHCM